eukprot:2530992-Rhodomonas_salina.1
MRQAHAQRLPDPRVRLPDVVPHASEDVAMAHRSSCSVCRHRGDRACAVVGQQDRIADKRGPNHGSAFRVRLADP